MYGTKIFIESTIKIFTVIKNNKRSGGSFSTKE